MLENVQCEIRANHSTIDHLDRPDAYIKKGWRMETILLACFNLEKAYDTTWRRGILQDLRSLGIRERMPKYISKFMTERRFYVTIDWIK